MARAWILIKKQSSPVIRWHSVTWGVRRPAPRSRKLAGGRPDPARTPRPAGRGSRIDLHPKADDELVRCIRWMRSATAGADISDPAGQGRHRHPGVGVQLGQQQTVDGIERFVGHDRKPIPEFTSNLRAMVSR
jgi:hypothetical protein